MKKLFLLATVAFLVKGIAFAQDDAPKSSPLEISGSGDLYYKYDLAKVPNIKRDFALPNWYIRVVNFNY